MKENVSGCFFVNTVYSMCDFYLLHNTQTTCCQHGFWNVDLRCGPIRWPGTRPVTINSTEGHVVWSPTDGAAKE